MYNLNSIYYEEYYIEVFSKSYFFFFRVIRFDFFVRELCFRLFLIIGLFIVLILYSLDTFIKSPILCVITGICELLMTTGSFRIGIILIL